jgi:hypothetical protein
VYVLDLYPPASVCPPPCACLRVSACVHLVAAKFRVVGGLRVEIWKPCKKRWLERWEMGGGIEVTCLENGDDLP